MSATLPPAQDLAPSPGSSWLLNWLTGVPRHSRTRSVTIVVLLVSFIGWFDYWTGPRLSLELC